MRQINFLIVFVFCLTLVLFSLENTEFTVVHLTPDLQLQAPLSVELLLAMGVGAVLAWVFSTWARLQRFLESRQTSQQIRQRDERIHELEQNLQQSQTDLDSQSLPSVPEPAVETVDTSEV